MQLQDLEARNLELQRKMLKFKAQELAGGSHAAVGLVKAFDAPEGQPAAVDSSPASLTFTSSSAAPSHGRSSERSRSEQTPTRPSPARFIPRPKPAVLLSPQTPEARADYVKPIQDVTLLATPTGPRAQPTVLRA